MALPLISRMQIKIDRRYGSLQPAFMSLVSNGEHKNVLNNDYLTSKLNIIRMELMYGIRENQYSNRVNNILLKMFFYEISKQIDIDIVRLYVEWESL